MTAGELGEWSFEQRGELFGAAVFPLAPGSFASGGVDSRPSVVELVGGEPGGAHGGEVVVEEAPQVGLEVTDGLG